jgi:hypothetical protein
MPHLQPKDLEAVYSALGRALWHVQYVEDALNALLTIKVDIGAPGKVTETEAKALLTKRLARPMGPAVKDAVANGLLQEADLQRLEQLKDMRDWVAHKVQRTVGDQIFSPWGRSDLLRRLEAITSEAQLMLDILLHEMKTFVESTGHQVVVQGRLSALLEADRASGA